MEKKPVRGSTGALFWILIFSQFIPFGAARPTGEPWLADPDDFAAEVANIVANNVVKKELPMLEGTFGILLMLLIKYFIWPPAKYWWGELKRKFSKPDNQQHPTSPSTSQPNVSIIEQVLMQQQTLLREMKDLMVEGGNYGDSLPQPTNWCKKNRLRKHKKIGCPGTPTNWCPGNPPPRANVLFCLNPRKGFEIIVSQIQRVLSSIFQLKKNCSHPSLIFFNLKFFVDLKGLPPSHIMK
jgi:hypothetical protein